MVGRSSRLRPAQMGDAPAEARAEPRVADADTPGGPAAGTPAPLAASAAHTADGLTFDAPRAVGRWVRLRVSDPAGIRMVFMIELRGLRAFRRHEALLRALCAHRFATDRETLLGSVITAEAIAAAQAAPGEAGRG